MEHPGSASRIRFWLAFFILGLLLSGGTAFSLGSEVHDLDMLLHIKSLQPIAHSTRLLRWIDLVQEGLSHTNAQSPYLAYGTDWLAFAHLVIAAAFIAPWINPQPVGHRMGPDRLRRRASAGSDCRAHPWYSVRMAPHDCSFGVLGAVTLVICWREIGELERMASAHGDKHV